MVIEKGIKDLYEMKLLRVQARELLVCMCNGVSNSSIEQRKKGRVDSAIIRSIEKGNFEFIFRMVRANPNLLWSRGENDSSIFSISVRHRQAKIFSLIYRLGVKKTMTTWVDKKGNNILHMAGKAGVSILLDRIPGAALQMQRELQWFKVISLISNFSHLRTCTISC